MTSSADFKTDPRRRCLKVEEWPAADRAAWNAARTLADPLEPASGGLGARWRPTSVKAFAKGYGRFLAYLSRNNLLDASAAPATRITPDAVGAFVTELRSLNAPATAASAIRLLNCAVRAMWPDQNWDWLRPVIRNLAYHVVPVREKRSRIIPIQELLAYGLELMAKAERTDSGSLLDRTLLYRDGLMIALLAARPLREGNFASIEIGRHLVRRGGTCWLCFEGTETKNHRPIELPIPEQLNPYLERYCSFYRPLLFPRNRGWTQGSQQTGETCRVLWLSSRGNPMPANTLYTRITTMTRVKFGHPLYPHLFRDCAATSTAIDDPGHVRIAAKVLGHSRFKTTEAYYIQARTVEAARQHQREITALRRGKACAW